MLEALITIAAMDLQIAMPDEVRQIALPIPTLIAVAADFPPLPSLRRIAGTLVALVTGARAWVLALAPSADSVKVESNVVPLHVGSPVLEDAASAVEGCEGEAVSAVEVCEEAAAGDAIGNGRWFVGPCHGSRLQGKAH
jgi:hypothetical protein